MNSKQQFQKAARMRAPIIRSNARNEGWVVTRQERTSRAFGSLIGATSFAALAYWLRDSWVAWPLWALAAINCIVLIVRALSSEDDSDE